MTKQEAIKQAVKKHYGRYYEFVEDHHDEWGWVNEKWLENTDFKSNVEYGRYADLIKPIALNGIEENNGWINIESVYDLPKETMACYFILKSNKAMLSGYFRNGCFDYALRYYDENDVTHYQPIITPEPPIY